MCQYVSLYHTKARDGRYLQSLNVNTVAEQCRIDGSALVTIRRRQANPVRAPIEEIIAVADARNAIEMKQVAGLRRVRIIEAAPIR